MSNIIDYVSWRGDLDFTASPFNEVDSLILTQLVYLDFRGIVPGIHSRSSVTLEKAAEEYFAGLNFVGNAAYEEIGRAHV